eukprot:scpid72666/ scgid14312/ 
MFVEWQRLDSLGDEMLTGPSSAESSPGAADSTSSNGAFSGASAHDDDFLIEAQQIQLQLQMARMQQACIGGSSGGLAADGIWPGVYDLANSMDTAGDGYSSLGCSMDDGSVSSLSNTSLTSGSLDMVSSWADDANDRFVEDILRSSLSDPISQAAWCNGLLPQSVSSRTSSMISSGVEGDVDMLDLGNLDVDVFLPSAAFTRPPNHTPAMTSVAITAQSPAATLATLPLATPPFASLATTSNCVVTAPQTGPAAVAMASQFFPGHVSSCAGEARRLTGGMCESSTFDSSTVNSRGAVLRTTAADHGQTFPLTNAKDGTATANGATPIIKTEPMANPSLATAEAEGTPSTGNNKKNKIARRRRSSSSSTASCSRCPSCGHAQKRTNKSSSSSNGSTSSKSKDNKKRSSSQQAMERHLQQQQQQQ